MADSISWQDWYERAERHFQRAMDDVIEYPTQASGELHFASELYLKAVILLTQRLPERTHVLEKILQSIDPNLSMTALEFAAADMLTKIGFQERYPGSFDEISPEEAQIMLNAAKVLRAYAREKLGLENL